MAVAVLLFIALVTDYSDTFVVMLHAFILYEEIFYKFRFLQKGECFA